MLNDDDMRLSAVHEAGHAIAFFHAQGDRVGSLEVFLERWLDPEWGGCTGLTRGLVHSRPSRYRTRLGRPASWDNGAGLAMPPVGRP